jgi:dihydroceramide fatty acyl 2-hydroxylase
LPSEYPAYLDYALMLSQQVHDRTTPRRAEALRASPPMFDSPLLDALSRVHPAVPVVIFAPAITVLTATALARLEAAATAALIVGGYLFWTLTEYWMHRLIFHFEPADGPGARLHWIIHGVHHDHPNDPMRLVMPPSVSIPLALVFLGLFLLVLGTPTAFAVAAGFYCGYLIYDMTHYHLHHHRSRTRLGKFLRQQHMRHHFQDDTRGFGVSAPFWDVVFGTAPRRRGERS